MRFTEIVVSEVVDERQFQVSQVLDGNLVAGLYKGGDSIYLEIIGNLHKELTHQIQIHHESGRKIQQESR